MSEFFLDEALISVVHEIEALTVELSDKLVANELLGHEVSLADVEREHRRTDLQINRKQSSISDRYNSSSFEEDINTSSRVSHSDEAPAIVRRKSPMGGGTGQFTVAFERKTLDHSSSSSSSGQSPTVFRKASESSDEDQQFLSDHDVESLSLKELHGRRRQPSEADEDADLLLSTHTGEKIYSTDFEESKSKRRQIDDDDDDVDTMKLSARSLNAREDNSYLSDDE